MVDRCRRPPVALTHSRPWFQGWCGVAGDVDDAAVFQAHVDAAAVVAHAAEGLDGLRRRSITTRLRPCGTAAGAWPRASPGGVGHLFGLQYCRRPRCSCARRRGRRRTGRTCVRPQRRRRSGWRPSGHASRHILQPAQRSSSITTAPVSGSREIASAGHTSMHQASSQCMQVSGQADAVLRGEAHGDARRLAVEARRRERTRRRTRSRGRPRSTPGRRLRCACDASFRRVTVRAPGERTMG